MKLILSGVTGSGVETLARILAARLSVPVFRGDDLGHRLTLSDQTEWCYTDAALNLRHCRVRGTELPIPECERGISAVIPITDGSDRRVVDRLERLNPHDLVIRCIAPDMFELTRRRNIWRSAHHLPILAYDGFNHDLHANDALFLSRITPRSEFITNHNIFKSILEILEICNERCGVSDRLRAAVALFKRIPGDLVVMPFDQFDTMLSCVDRLKGMLASSRHSDVVSARPLLICDILRELLNHAQCMPLHHLTPDSSSC